MHNSSSPTVTHHSNDLQTTRCTSCPDPETERLSNHDSHIISMTSLVTTTTHAPYTVMPHHSNNTHTYKYLRGIYLQSYIYSTTFVNRMNTALSHHTHYAHMIYINMHHTNTVAHPTHCCIGATSMLYLPHHVPWLTMQSAGLPMVPAHYIPFKDTK